MKPTPSHCQSTCKSQKCTTCNFCLQRHCRCGSFNVDYCNESRACGCRSANRCEVCYGCRDGLIRHCRCQFHAQKRRRLDNCKHVDEEIPSAENCACHVSQVESRKQESIPCDALSQISIPTRRSSYAKKLKTQEQDLKGDYNLYEFNRGCSNYEGCLRSHYLSQSNGKVHGTSGDTYTERNEVCTNISRHTPVKEYANEKVYDRLLNNCAFFEESEGAECMEDLIDYLIHVSSLKIARVPELIGSLDKTAVQALGILVEEYIRQEVINWSVQGLTLPTTNAAKRQVLELWRVWRKAGNVSNEDISTSMMQYFHFVYGEEYSSIFSKERLKLELEDLNQDEQKNAIVLSKCLEAVEKEPEKMNDVYWYEDRFGRPSYFTRGLVYGIKEFATAKEACIDEVCKESV